MDFSLSNEQRSWQMAARKFAQDEIKPIALDLDEAPDAHGTFNWDIIEKGSKLGFRTLAVPKDFGGEGTDYVTQALVMAELARGDVFSWFSAFPTASWAAQRDLRNRKRTYGIRRGCNVECVFPWLEI